MSSANNRVFRFGSFSLDLVERQLLDGDDVVRLTPKAFDVLAVLVENAGHLLTKDELMNKVWPDTYIEEVNLPRIIHTLRKVLGKAENGNIFIETVPKTGYRFVARVECSPASSPVSDLADLEAYEKVTHTGKPQNEKTISERFAFFASGGGALRGRFFLAGASALVLIAVIGLVLRWGYRSYAADVSIKMPPTSNGEAFQRFQQGRFFLDRRYVGDEERALESFEKAIELDPSFSEAYAGKADAQTVLFWDSNTHDDISEARTAVIKALELNPDSVYGHSIICRILATYDWQHEEAAKHCMRAVGLGPDNADALREWAFLLNSLGREREAIDAIEKSISISPTSIHKRYRGMILYQSRRYADAIEQLEAVDRTDPGYGDVERWLIRAYAMNGNHRLALECYTALLRRSGSSENEIAGLKSAFDREGLPAVLRHVVNSKERKNLFLSGALAQLGEKDRAFEALTEMADRRAVMLVTLAREPTLDPLRSDPRYEQLLNRIAFKNK